MSVCFYPSTMEQKYSKFEKFRFIDNILIRNFVSKSKLEGILNKILIECEFSVIGYERSQDKYWCKKINNKICELHFEIQIFYNDYNSSIVKIMPLMGTTRNIKSFVDDLSEHIYLYESSSFTQYYLENLCA